MNHSLPAGAWLEGSGLIWPEENREAPAEDSSFILSSTVFLIAAGETVSWSAMVCSSLEKQRDTGSAFLLSERTVQRHLQWTVPFGTPSLGLLHLQPPFCYTAARLHLTPFSESGSPWLQHQPSRSLSTLSPKLSLPMLGQGLVSPVPFRG